MFKQLLLLPLLSFLVLTEQYKPTMAEDASEKLVNPGPSSSIIWKSAPHNNWNAASQIVLNGNPYYPESAEKPYSLQMSSNTTTPIMRGEVRNNELWGNAQGGNDTERSELDGFSVVYPKGTEFWFSYQLMVEPGAPQISTAGGFPGGPLAWGVIGQIHGKGNGAAVPFGLSFVSETLSVRTQTGAQVETIHWTMPGKLARGQVYSIVGEIKITGDAQSTLSVWVDGRQVCNVKGTAIGNAVDTANYFKVGIYRGWQGDGYPPLSVQIANVEQGKASLFARVSSPVPWPTVK
jgi:Polysaccharide lyase